MLMFPFTSTLRPPQIQLPYEQKAHSDLIMSLSSYD